MITGCFRQAGSWISCLIDGLERTSTSSAGSKQFLTALEGVAFLSEAATVRIEYEGARCSDSRARLPGSLAACRSIHEHHRCGSSAAAPRSIREHSLASGYRIDFPLNGSLQNWKLVVGAADPTD